MVINITINKTFSIPDSLKNNSCYNVFNQKGMNTFNVLTFIQARTDKNKFMQIKNGKVRIYFHKWFMWIFDLLEVNKITTKFLTCFKSSKQSFKKRFLGILKHEDWE